MASALLSAAKGLLLLPFLPAVLLRRAVCRKEKDFSSSSSPSSSSSSSSSATPRGSGRDGLDDDGGDGWQSASKSMPVHRVASGGSDGPVSRFNTVRSGMETKGSPGERAAAAAAAAPAAADPSAGELRGDGGGGGGGYNSSNDAESWSSSTLRRRRTRDYSFSETSELAFNDGDASRAPTPTGYDDDDRPSGGGVGGVGGGGGRGAATPTSPVSRRDSDVDTGMTTATAGANPMLPDPRFSREQRQSIERAQRFIRSDSGGDRDVMEKLLLADRTHGWLKKL